MDEQKTDEKKIILMIDDDSMMLQRAYEILQPEFDVRQAKSAKQGLQFVTRTLPDLILLDISMPEMDGYQTMEEIRKIHNCKDIPIVFLTSLDDTDSEVKGLSLGAVDYIRKPFVPEILISRVKRRLEDSVAGRKNASMQEQTAMIEYDPDKLQEMKSRLSGMEYQVAKLVAAGYDNKEISEKLMISYSYEKQIVSRIFTKLGTKKRSEIKLFFVKQ